MSVSLTEIAAQTGLSEAALAVLQEALIRGRGTQAQFNHPELGGMGQWMQGGMVMIGDMFNTALAGKVALACTLLSSLDAVRAPAATPTWWPETLGIPSQSASQGSLDYAYFPASQRLAVRHEGAVTLYNLSGVTFQGVSAQSGQLTVSTSTGSYPLHTFPVSLR